MDEPTRRAGRRAPSAAHCIAHELLRMRSQAAMCDELQVPTYALKVQDQVDGPLGR